MQNKANYKLIKHRDEYKERGEYFSSISSYSKDEKGIPNIKGKTDASCAFSLAFALCEDDFRKIQYILATSKGILGETVASSKAPSDFLIHWVGNIHFIEKYYEDEVPTKDKEILEAYASGINYYALLHESEILHSRLYPVTGKDILCHILYVPQDMIHLHSLAAIILSNDTLSVGVSPRVSSPITSYEEYNQFFRKKKAESADFKASTAYATSPQNSKDKKSTFLAINPHQVWDSSSLYYLVSIQSEEDWNMKGFAIPGIPVPLMGHNENLGWAHTVNHPDIVDVYLLKENPENEDQYKFDGRWENYETRTVYIGSNLLGFIPWAYEKQIKTSRFGPVAKTPTGTIALSYSGLTKDSLHFVSQYLGINKARTLEEWEKSMRITAMPLLNSIYADNEGNIFYHYGARVPNRDPHYLWSYLIPGESSETLWSDFVSYDSLPHVLNPSSGFLQNCNTSPFNISTSDNPVTSSWSPTLGIERTMNNRGLRLLELLSSNTDMTWDEFIAIKFDWTYHENSTVVQLTEKIYNSCISALENREQWAMNVPQLPAALANLKKWDHTVHARNQYATIPLLTLYPYIQLDPWALDPSEWIKNNFDAILDRFLLVINQMVNIYGRLDIEWGAVHRYQTEDGDEPMSGGPDLLFCLQGIPVEDKLKITAGDGIFMFVGWDENGVRSETFNFYDKEQAIQLRDKFSLPQTEPEGVTL